MQVSSGGTLGKVQWREWGSAAFERAKQEDKLVFLSLSAAWCHWCHVMDEGTFEDDEVAERLNRDFITVRVDSDRYPDINDRYNMGGWPSIVFLTSDGEIVWGSTYLAPEPMRQLLKQFKEGFATYRSQIFQEIKAREEKIRQIEENTVSGTVDVNIDLFRKTLNGVVATFDPLYGGFGRAPKFPMVSSLDVLLVALDETGGDDFRQMVVRTLDAMAEKGMYDSVEGGFFRYATTEMWSTPHYEKMCEDNAHLARLYLAAAELTQTKRYQQKAEHVLKWVMKRLCDAERAIFFNSQDADETYYTANADDRKKMNTPKVDKTVFTDTNAMMSIAFLRAWACADDPRYRDIAVRNIEFLSTRMRAPDGAFYHYYDGEPHREGLLRDQLWMARLFLDAYEAIGLPEYLAKAEELCQLIVQRYWDRGQKGVLDRLITPQDVGELKHSKKELVENALFAETLCRLSYILPEKSYHTRAETIVRNFPDYLGQYGHFTAQYALAVSRLLRPPTEIMLISKGGQAPEPVRQAAYKVFHSRKTIRHMTQETAQTEKKIQVKKVPAVIICLENECLEPAYTPQDVLARINSLRGPE